MDIQVSFCLAAIAVGIIFATYNTEVLSEYGRLFRMNRILNLEEYFCFKLSNGAGVNYFDFLKSKSNNFITRLLSCPYCSGFWLCLIISIGRQNPFVVYGLYLLMYKNLIYGKNA